VTCSECGVDTEVPFNPTSDRPVYCRTCFQNK
jgi:CxxC-x17-CxxC domain-containing protein